MGLPSGLESVRGFGCKSGTACAANWGCQEVRSSRPRGAEHPGYVLFCPTHASPSHSDLGRKPGDVKMIQNGTLTEAHQVCFIFIVRAYLDSTFQNQWDSAGNQWQKIGEVVDAIGSGRKQLYEGKEYDYVFDVDIQDGVPPLKLPYNANGMFHYLRKGRIVTRVYRKLVHRCSTLSRKERPSAHLY